VPLVPAQALMMAGVFRHCLHPGETSLESQEKWGKLIYPAGLLLLAGISITLGVWGWDGARTIGLWWWPPAVLLLAVGIAFLVRRMPTRFSLGNVSGQWGQILPLQRFYRLFTSVYDLFHRLSDIFTSSLEGEGGLLWSFLLLVVIISILSTGVK
jgi:hypothetical protein